MADSSSLSAKHVLAVMMQGDEVSSNLIILGDSMAKGVGFALHYDVLGVQALSMMADHQQENTEMMEITSYSQASNVPVLAGTKMYSSMVPE
jgi:hypothetical protein